MQMELGGRGEKALEDGTRSSVYHNSSSSCGRAMSVGWGLRFEAREAEREAAERWRDDESVEESLGRMPFLRVP